MQVKKIVCIIFFFTLMSFASLDFARDNESEKSELSELRQQILELQRQMKEMKSKHENEIKALQDKIEKLSPAEPAAEEVKTEEEADYLRKLAQDIVGEEKEEKTPEETVFKFGGLSLQQLNPEISVTGDFLFSSRQDTTSRKSSDFEFRTLGVHVESWLDPYSRFKAAIPVTEGETKLGEGYVTLYDISDDLNLTLGKFRQQFGVVNRWHKHGLDQVDFPLALGQIFGNEGLNQSGLSLDWMMPPADDVSQQLTFQVTDGSNSRLFGDNARNRPSLLAHYIRQVHNGNGEEIPLLCCLNLMVVGNGKEERRR